MSVQKSKVGVMKMNDFRLALSGLNPSRTIQPAFGGVVNPCHEQGELSVHAMSSAHGMD